MWAVRARAARGILVLALALAGLGAAAPSLWHGSAGHSRASAHHPAASAHHPAVRRAFSAGAGSATFGVQANRMPWMY